MKTLNKSDVVWLIFMFTMTCIIVLSALNRAETRIRDDIAALQNDIAEVGAMCRPEFFIHQPELEPLGEHPALIPWATPAVEIK